MMDWEHVGREPEPGSYVAAKLNRLRLDQLQAITAKHYDIEEWREATSSIAEGRLRLTEDILRRYPHLSRRELETQSVSCVARRRSLTTAAHDDITRTI